VSALATTGLVALLTGAFALGGIWMQWKRDHDRWIRQVRLDAYIELAAAVLAFTGNRFARKLTIDSMWDEIERSTDMKRPSKRKVIELAGDPDAVTAAVDRLTSEEIDGLDEIDVAVAKVSLAGPPALVDRAVGLRSLVVKGATDNDPSLPGQALRALNDFATEARKYVDL
jgi:hypothetical protein